MTKAVGTVDVLSISRALGLSPAFLWYLRHTSDNGAIYGDLAVLPFVMGAGDKSFRGLIVPAKVVRGLEDASDSTSTALP